MSIANLLVPNNYNIQVASLAINGQAVSDPIISGGFTPVMTGTGMTALTNLFSYYTEIGSQVIVNMKLQYNDSNGGNPNINIHVPIARSMSGNFSNGGQACGVGTVNITSMSSPGAFIGSAVCNAIVGGQTVTATIASSGGANLCFLNLIFNYQI